jgi:sporulation protein YtfJ
MESALQGLKGVADVNTIIGNPIETPDGTVIIPVSKVSLGFGVGGSDIKGVSSAVDGSNLFGGGSGGGIKIDPVAFLVVGAGEVQLLSLESNGVNLAEAIPEVVDFVASLMSLPRIFNTDAASIPGGVPYIQTSKAIEKRWRNKVDSLSQGRKKIGVVWAGNPKHANDRHRSIPFSIFQRLFAVPDIAWFSLQVGRRAADVKAVSEVIDCASELTDFSKTAGLIATLDLVITVDTAVAHLAGAMGKDTWILQPYYPDWRWQLKRTDSPWYPTVRLFRQQARGEWSGVIEKVIEELKKLFIS